MTRRVRSFSAARRATVRVCDREGTHRGQGLLLHVEGEGTVVLTCHHITAQLPPDSVYVSLPDEDGRLGAPRRAYYDEGRSRPRTDAVVLRLEGLEISERPLLQRLDPAEYSGNLDVIGLTHLTPTSFDATLSASTPLEINVPTPDAILPPGSKYVIPQAFRLANPTYSRQGISGAVIVRNGGVLGLAQSARKATDDRQAEAYLLPLGVWAEGWEALSTLLESFTGEVADPYGYALQDYLRAVRIFSADTPYLALDELLSGARRTLHEVYVPLRGRPVNLPSTDTRTEEGDEGSSAVPATSNETSPEQEPRPTEEETAKKTNTQPVLTLADMFRRASENPGQADLLLQGPAGLGKSTALRHITENAWSQPHLIGLSRPHLPIVIRLQVMAGERGGSIEEWLLNGLRRAGDMALERIPPAGFFSVWSTRENAPWLLLLDGLDEVAAEHRGEVLRWIKVLLQKLEGQHRVVLTSRPAGDEQYRELASKFTVCDVLPFDEDQQIDLAKRWLPNAADDFLSKVKRISAGNLFREPLAMTPLLLTIAAAVYRRHGDLPESGKVELYGRFIDILFEEARRRGLRDELEGEVFDVARGGLEKLALATTEHPEENTPTALAYVSAEFLREELGWAETRAETRGRQFVEVMGRRTGVLHLKGDTFHWVHPTIREYLAAQALDRQLRRPGNDYTKVIGERLLDEGWYDVLWNLTFIHQDRQALICWMSREARDGFDADAALLAYDCWQDSEPVVREALKHDIVGALVGGLGDSQSGLARRDRLLQYLTQMGGDVTERLITLLEEYNGLQRQLLPEWNEEERRPSIHTEPGKRIYAGFRLRGSIVKVLGDIGDERAVEPLISLLDEEAKFDSFRWDIARDARRALRCTGLISVGPLLARITDAALPTKSRLDCLTALGVVGIRTAAVTPILDACMREGLHGDAGLLARSLWAARRLGDRTHQTRAISALASDNKDVVSEAALYLSRTPDVAGFEELDRAFGKWLSDAEDYYARDWTLRKLAAALLATGNTKAKKTVVDFIKAGLEERGKLPPDQAAQAADEVQLPSLPPLLLKELVRRLSLPAPGFIVGRLVERLGETWRPDQTRSLVRAAGQYGAGATGDGGFAGRIVDICVGNEQEGESERSSLRERLDRKDVMRMMAKCQVSNFVAQAERLLPDAKFWMVSQLSDALWVVGDTSAESALLAALNNFTRPVTHADDPMPEEYDILRALGTCCTERGAQAVMSYVRENPNLSIHLHEEVLCTLVRRGVLDVNTLAQMAQDMKGTHEFVRRACVLALGYLGAPRFTSEFLTVIESETDEEARAYAAAFLGWAETDGSRAVEALRNVLTTTNKSFLARRAAQALARLKVRDSLQIIESAAERFDAVGSAAGLLRAAARFRALSTLELLKNLPAETRTQRELHTEADIIAAFGEFYQKDSAAREIVDAQLEYKQLPYDSGRQQIAVGVLAERNPNGLLRRATEMYDQGHLEPSARTALINCFYRLGKSKRVDKTRLVEVMKRLLCEDDLSMREEAGERLQFVAAPLRIRIYDELRAMSSEWAQACAVYSLGFWDSDEKVIERERFDVSPVVRKLASVAAAMRSKRSALRRLTRTFRTTRGVARLSAYYSLLEQATDAHIDMLYLNTREGDLTRIHLGEIRQGIERRVKEERKKRAKEEEDAICEKVRQVRFN